MPFCFEYSNLSVTVHGNPLFLQRQMLLQSDPHHLGIIIPKWPKAWATASQHSQKEVPDTFVIRLLTENHHACVSLHNQYKLLPFRL